MQKQTIVIRTSNNHLNTKLTAKRFKNIRPKLAAVKNFIKLRPKKQKYLIKSDKILRPQFTLSPNNRRRSWLKKSLTNENVGRKKF